MRKNQDNGKSSAKSTAGQIGALTRWAHAVDPHAQLEPARRGFRNKFLSQVDPENKMDSRERELRASRLLRAHMLRLAARSAEVRREKKLAKD